MLNVVLYVSYVIQYDDDIELVSKIDSIRRNEVMNVIDEAFIGGFWKGVDPNGGVVLLDADWVQWEIVGHDLWMTAFIHLGLDKISGDRKLLVSVNEALMHMGRDIGSSAMGRLAIDIFPTGIEECEYGNWLSGLFGELTEFIDSLLAETSSFEAYVEFRQESLNSGCGSYFRDFDCGRYLSVKEFEKLELKHVSRVLDGPGLVIKNHPVGGSMNELDDRFMSDFSRSIEQLNVSGSISSILLDFHLVGVLGNTAEI